METKIDVSKLEFSSDVFPNDADMKLWNSLTAQEKHDYLVHWEEEGFKSGAVPHETLDARFERLTQKRAV